MFSVVIPIFNHAKFLASAVRSAQQSPLVREILLLDDGSQDSSAAIAARLAAASGGRVRNIITDGGNHGAHNRLNELVQLAACDWVAVLNSDDAFLPGRFEAVLEKPEFASCDFVFGNVLFMNDRGALTGAKCGPFDFGLTSTPATERLSKLLVIENYLVTTSNMIFRKTLHARIGGFGAFRYVHDWDFALRAMALGNPLYVQRFLTAYRLHGNNTIQENETKVNLESKAVLARYAEDFPDRS
jgi:glycosyltransferase involved in cell wall biosynthesis